jgi:hypothetical protein
MQADKQVTMLIVLLAVFISRSLPIDILGAITETTYLWIIECRAKGEGR